jgi:hypothetical protein
VEIRERLPAAAVRDEKSDGPALTISCEVRARTTVVVVKGTKARTSRRSSLAPRTFHAPQDVHGPHRDGRVRLVVGETAGEQPYRLRQYADLLFQPVHAFVGARGRVQWGKQLPAHCLPSSREAPD